MKTEKNIHADVVGQSEDALQQKCFFWFHNSYPNLRGLLFHVPNGGTRNAREGAKFKAMGVVSGVADLLFIYGGTMYCLELKTEIGRQSDKQLEWELKVKNQGLEYHVIRSLEEFKEVIKKIVV